MHPPCRRLLSAIVLLVTLSAAGQTAARLTIGPDQVLPPPPKMPLEQWTDEDGRTRVSLQVAQGTMLRGYHYAAPGASAPEMLFINGLGLAIAKADSLYRTLAASGVSVTVYDARGGGFSDGPASAMAMQGDELAAFDAIRKAAGSRPVLVYGVSLGTAAAAYVASQRSVSALVLGMPIASADEELPVYARLLGFSDQEIAGTAPSDEARALLNERALVARSTAPLLVLGGTADRVVPIQQNREVFAASPSANKRFVEVPDANHAEVILTDIALNAFRSLLARLPAGQ